MMHQGEETFKYHVYTIIKKQKLPLKSFGLFKYCKIKIIETSRL